MFVLLHFVPFAQSEGVQDQHYLHDWKSRIHKYLEMKFWIYCVLREACCQEAVFYCPVWGMLRTENPLVIPVSDAAAPGIVSGEITWGSGLTLCGETGMF